MTEKQWDGVMAELAQIPPPAFLEWYKPNVVISGAVPNSAARRSQLMSNWPETRAAEGKNATLFVKQDDDTWSPLAEVASVRLEYAQGIEPTAVYKDEFHKWKHYAEQIESKAMTPDHVREAEGMNSVHYPAFPTRGLQGFHYHKAKRRLKKGDRKIARSLTSS